MSHTHHEGTIAPISLEDPALGDLFFPPRYHSCRPLAFYSQYWGLGEGALLDNDNIFRPRGQNALYFFKQYEYMVKRIDSFRAYCKDLERRRLCLPHALPGVVIIGTPGIGKTSFLKYYLARELSKGNPVIYINGAGCYIFNGRHVYVSGTVPHFGLGFLHTLCLVDADTKTPAPAYLLHSSYPFLLMAASRQEEHYSRWTEQRASGLSPKFVLNPPEEDELVRALNVQGMYSKLSSEDILKAIRSYGCNMRTLGLVLGNREHVDGMISMTANQLETSKLKTIITSNVGYALYSIVTTVCLKQPQPNEERAYRSSDMHERIITSPIVMNALLRAHGKAVYVELIHSLETFSRIPEARASAGWVWEHWANAQISRGGDFILNPITFKQPTRTTRQSKPTNRKTKPAPISDTTQRISISIPPLNMRFFDIKELPSATRDHLQYFIPASENNATFDAFFHSERCGIGLQMTLSDAHDLKVDGLNKLYDRLQARQRTKHMYVVVIRKGHRFKNFKPTPTPEQQERFRFFTMELELPAGADPKFFNEDMTSFENSNVDGEMLDDENVDGKISIDEN